MNPTDIPESIFRAYDIRGVVATALTPDAVREIGRAVGTEAQRRGDQTVAVARDGRLSGPALLDALAEGIASTGADVIDLGMVPTPVLYYATHTLDTGSGVMVTGSHNPPEYNGLKMVLAGETLAEAAIQDLKRRVYEGDVRQGAGKRSSLDLREPYLERILSDVKLARPIKVAVDAGNGVAGELAPKLLKALGCEVTAELFCDIDGTFPNHHPDPAKPSNLQDVIAAVKATGAELGLAFDGDGDRVGVVTAKGDIIWPDRLLMLWAADVVERNPGGRIIYDVKCSRHVHTTIAAHGGDPMMWKTGHSLIKGKMRETGALLAGEMSGHVFFKERWYGFDDALYASARLLEILAKDPRTPTEVFDALPDSINTPELNVCFEEGGQIEFMNNFTALGPIEGAQIATIDGVRADFSDGFGLVRASNTTPCLVIRFEADDEAALARIKDIFRARMEAASPGIDLPF